jgi:hypothetical protein
MYVAVLTTEDHRTDMDLPYQISVMTGHVNHTRESRPLKEGRIR